LNIFLFDPETKLLENIVAIHLMKKYGDDLCYYNRNIEVDFFVPKAGLAIQVSYDLTSEKTREREIKALMKLSEIYTLNKLLIITYDNEMMLNEQGLEVHVVPVWKWLLL
jgi:hypothetical protein